MIKKRLEGKNAKLMEQGDVFASQTARGRESDFKARGAQASLFFLASVFNMGKMGTWIKLFSRSDPSLKFSETALLCVAPYWIQQFDLWHQRSLWLCSSEQGGLSCPWCTSQQLSCLFQRKESSASTQKDSSLVSSFSFIHTSSMFLIQFLILSKDFSFVMS